MAIFGHLVMLCVLVCCSAIEGPQMIEKPKDNHLPRLDPIKVGFSRDYNVFQTTPGKNHLTHTTKIITRSTKPPIFEISKFITEEECDHLLNYANLLGFMKSPQIKDETEISEETSEKTFNEWDYDKDGFITPREIAWLPGKSDLYVTNEDILKMFDDLEMDKDHDGVISFEEFKKVTVPSITAYFDKLREIPHMRSRNSEQAWMFHDNPKYPLLADFHERLHRLTGLPKHMIRHSEPIQVVKYGVHGHYHSHHDSDEVDNNKSCCTLRREENCRLCRYMTVLVFLNEPEEGGETAFPFANNKTFSQEALKVEGHKLNLARHCYDGNLAIKPQKGKAIMWYNHHRDPRSGWLGKLDLTTYHGGCDVIKGTKFIANMWFDVIGKPGSEESYKGWLHSGADPKKKKDEL